jgi:hypothetical protein
MSLRSAASTFAILGLVLGCHKPRIACTTGALKACFGTDVTFTNFGTDSTRVKIDIQNLQGTVAQDNTAWSQLLYIRVYRNMNPPLGFPNGGSVVPTWTATVQPLGPSPAGSGWRNSGANSPSFVSEWVATGGSYGSNVGYVSGRDTTYNQVVNAGAGLRTFSGVGRAPGWVTFSFVAHHRLTASDIGIQVSAWASTQPARSLAAPTQVGCQLITGGGPIAPPCEFFAYNLP